jgi:hypothetical protein
MEMENIYSNVLYQSACIIPFPIRLFLLNMPLACLLLRTLTMQILRHGVQLNDVTNGGKVRIKKCGYVLYEDITKGNAFKKQ